MLRALAATRRPLRPAAQQLTLRLAEPVRVGDLGRVTVHIGDEQARILRRKVLALLCFLCTRPRMAATRDEVLEALWPELGPDTASNSLHQTIYFLRRVFEPDYREGLSAGYVVYDGDVVSLDNRLFASDSQTCWQMVRSAPADAESAALLLDIYDDRFAIDFAYEEWASDYRDNLHAAVLARVESAISTTSDARGFDTAIALGIRVLAIDPSADGVELALLRNYKASGLHAAAAEQYAHYAAFVRDELGAEPPGYEEI
jgi:DNA-binding SARP family transcriptional activator